MPGLERPCSCERRELADRVADDDVRLEAALAHRREDREARGDERRLLYLRVDELLERRREAELLEVEPGRLGSDPIHLACRREGLGDLAPHSFLERPLSGEAESDLRHRGLPFVHSMSAEPQVRPAPIPVSSTSVPSCSRPSARASARASGMEPDEVFP